MMLHGFQVWLSIGVTLEYLPKLEILELHSCILIDSQDYICECNYTSLSLVLLHLFANLNGTSVNISHVSSYACSQEIFRLYPDKMKL